LKRRGSRGAAIHAGAIIAGRRSILVGAGTIIGPGAILDAREGPVIIGRDVRVHPGAVLEGPCFVGDESTVKIHARIYGGTSIGRACRVGGEITRSVLLSYASKQHDGFLGDSYVGSWVNLAAGTTTSNVKNTYGTVRIRVNGKDLDTGRMFLGLLAGDHGRTGVNSTLNTGTVIGPSAHVFGGGLTPKSVPAFSWGGSGGLTTYEPEKALAVAETAMARRAVTMSDSYKTLFRHVFAITAHEREHLAV
jgi:UDP-N-acetylglucosamine diphosphorylase/glucosamine-1-phosphate N-acetyltransferase